MYLQRKKKVGGGKKPSAGKQRKLIFDESKSSVKKVSLAECWNVRILAPFLDDCMKIDCGLIKNYLFQKIMNISF